MSNAVLGLSFDYHDAAAAVLVDGKLVAAASEERFTRCKHDASLPRHAIEWALQSSGVAPGDLRCVTFYDKPFTTYDRILATTAIAGVRSLPTAVRALPTWSKSKLWVRYRIASALDRLGHSDVPVMFAEHHQSHAASAFYPSPFERAAIVTCDGVGEWATSSIGWGAGPRIEMRSEMRFPDSVGLFYSAMTAFCGFAVNDGEYKLMGLAPYGQDDYSRKLREHVIDVHDDGSITLNQRWFDYRVGKRMTKPRMSELLDGPPRASNAPLTQREANIARSTQVILEDVVLNLASHAHEVTGESNLCLSGGVALNCVANGRLLREGPFDDIWIQPASGDDGSAVGAAYWAWHQLLGEPRTVALPDGMGGAALGPRFDDDEIASWLHELGVAATRHTSRPPLHTDVAARLAEGSVVGWFQGRMEFGPRALGHRSILADPRDPDMVQRINLAVKKREGFRPFAPAVLAEHASEWFEVDRPSPYMLRTAQVAPHRLLEGPDGSGVADGFADRLRETRSTVPSCTHVDGSARVQTVDRDRAPEFHALLSAFNEASGCPVLLNTSFNRKDEPIVRTPSDALRCFIDTDLDVLVLENHVIDRTEALSALDLAEAGRPA